MCETKHVFQKMIPVDSSDVYAGGCLFLFPMNFPQADNHLEHQTTFSPSEHAWVDVLCVGFLILMFQVIRFEHPNL